jgi:selenocysteine lyase/cysteine desulfurase
MKPLLDAALFDLDPQQTWVMHCAEGPIPRAAAAAVQDLLQRELQPWRMRWQEDFIGLPAAVREEAARLVNASPSDITLATTTSHGLTMVAQGYPWEPGSEVVAPLGEFPTNAWPWKALAARGVHFREVPLWEGHRSGAEAWTSAPPRASDEPEQRLLDALSPRTRVLTVSWVRFQDGLRLNLGQLAQGCALRGVDLVVDGIQGVGTLPVDLKGVAAFASGGHKGLLSPQGLGFLWTDPAFRLRLIPSGSWLSVDDATRFERPSTDFNRDWVRDGQRLEQGVPNLLACAALKESLRTLNGVGAEALGRHVHALQGLLLDGLSTLEGWQAEEERLRGLWRADRLGSILSLHHGTRAARGLDALIQRGGQHGVMASVREGYLRVAFHGMHGGEDVARVLRWLAG